MSIREYACEEWAGLGSFWRMVARIEFWIFGVVWSFEFVAYLWLSFHAGRMLGFEEFNRMFFSARW